MDENTPTRERHRRRRLVLQNLGLVHSFLLGRLPGPKVPTEVLPPSISGEDLQQAGIMGLVIAAERYDESLGYAFSTYAVYWIRCMIQRAWESSHLVHVPCYLRRTNVPERPQRGSLPKPTEAAARVFHAKIGMLTFDNGDAREVMPPDPHTTEDAADLRELAEVDDILEELPERERVILRLIYFKGLDRTHAGLEMGVTKQRARYLHNRALQHLRERLHA